MSAIRMTGERLAELRGEMGLTQAQLADRLSVIRTTVTDWERGASRVPAWLPLALAAVQKNLEPLT